ncbi:MAG: UDP-N-acetylglucosamine 2-epimerase [Pirellulales bacterium]
MSISTPETARVGQATILSWMDGLHAAARRAAWSDLLNFEGVDAFDVLLSPIYLSVLNALRNGPGASALGSQHPLTRLRNWAYRCKIAYRERQAARDAAAATPIGPTDVLFWTRDITHTSIMAPVAEAVTAQHIACRLMACQPKVLTTLNSVVRDPVYTVAAWPEAVHAARREGLRRARLLARESPWSLDELSVEPVPPVVAAAVHAAVVEYLPLAAESIANTQQALDAFRPRVLVVGNDLTAEGRAGCRVAAIRGVPTAMFTHGSVNGDALQAMHCADRVLVYGNRQRQVLTQIGIDAARIVVCGAPNLDARPRQSGQIHPLLQSRLGLRPDARWILVATSGPGNRISHEHHQQVIENVAALCRALPDVPVIVKLHRKDLLQYYQAAVAACHGRLVVLADDAPGVPREIFDWLQGCTVVLTGASAVAVEAMLMDVPVITMDFREEVREVDFIDAGATIHVRTGDELLERAQAVVRGTDSGKDTSSRVTAYLEDAFCALDGRSSERGARALRDMFTLARKS